MTLAFYFDHHVQRAIAIGLRRLGIDVLTASEDGAMRSADDRLLERATEMGRVFVSNDHDLLLITARWRRENRHWAGLAFLTEQQLPIGKAIEDLRLLAEASTAEQMSDHIEYLPL